MTKNLIILLIISLAWSNLAIETENKFAHLYDELFEQYGCLPSNSNYQNSWLVDVKQQAADGLKVICQGTLISPKYVLTTAYCLDKKLHSISVANIDYPVKSQKVHENYRRRSKLDDIGIIQLERSVESIKPICLPFTLEMQEKIPEKLDVVHYNYQDQLSNSNRRPIEKSVSTHHLDKCREYFETFEITNFEDGYMCADFFENFRKNYGAPAQSEVQFNEKPITVLYGILALAVSTGKENQLAAYINVPHYMNWILENTTD